MAAYRVYLRHHGPFDRGRVSDKTTTESATIAMLAFRELLARDDLSGQKIAAVMSVPRPDGSGNNSWTYFSRFDQEYGNGRIAANDPRLDPLATRAMADLIALSLPPDAPG